MSEIAPPERITPQLLEAVSPVWELAQDDQRLQKLLSNGMLIPKAISEFEQDLALVWRIPQLIQEQRVVWAHELKHADTVRNHQKPHERGHVFGTQSGEFMGERTMNATLESVMRFAGGFPLPQLSTRGSVQYQGSGLENWQIRQYEGNPVDMNLRGFTQMQRIQMHTAELVRSVVFVPVARRRQEGIAYDSNFFPSYRSPYPLPYVFHTIVEDQYDISWVQNPGQKMSIMAPKKSESDATHPYFQAIPISETRGSSQHPFMQLPEQGNFIIIAEPIQLQIQNNIRLLSSGSPGLGDEKSSAAMFHKTKIQSGAQSGTRSREAHYIPDTTRPTMVHQIKVVGVERTENMPPREAFIRFLNGG